MRTTKKHAALSIVLGTSLALASAGTAQAGRGGSPQAIRSAIAANSIDAIQAELERAEYLVCASCTDLVMPLVDHLDYRVRKVAAWWLIRRGTSRQVTTAMLNRLAQPDSLLARNAADVLGEFGKPSTIPALGAALANPVFTGEARAAMARALGSIGRAAAVPALVGALGDADPMVKAAAVVALRDVQGFNDSSVAIPLLGDADEQVRAAAATSMGMFRTRSATIVDALVASVANDPSATVRRKAAWALGEVGAPAAQAATALQKASSSDANAGVRALARASITKLTTTAAP